MIWGSRKQDASTGEVTTRRAALARFASVGTVATVGAGVAELLGTTAARADTPTTTQLPATMVLNALPADSAVAQAIEDGCCIVYTRDEGACSPSCGSGYCCYHVTSSGCGINVIECIEVSCAEGNFTTGC